MTTEQTSLLQSITDAFEAANTKDTEQQAQINEMLVQLADRDRQLGENQDALRNAQSNSEELLAVRQELDSVRGRLTESETICGQLQADLDTTKQALSDAQNLPNPALAEANTQLASATAQLQVVTGERDDARQAIVDLQARIDAAQGQVGTPPAA